MKTMKAVVVEKPGVVGVKEMPMPIIGDDDFLVEVKACSICNATDNHIFLGMFEGYNDFYPQILGHEICGIVRELVKNVTEVAAGDRIACCTYDAIAEYTKVNRFNLWMKPAPHVADKVATICEMLHGSYLGIVLPARLQKTDSVLIIGQGPMGLTTTAVTKPLAGTVSTVDLFDNRVAMSLDVGADFAYNRSKFTNKGILEAIHKNTGPVDVVFMCISEDRSAELDAYDLAVDALKENGRMTGLVVAAKIVRENHRPNMLKFLEKNIKYKHFLEADSYGDFNTMHYFQQGMELINNGTVDISKLITHEITFDEIEKGLDLCWNHLDQVIKVVIYPPGKERHE